MKGRQISTISGAADLLSSPSLRNELKGEGFPPGGGDHQSCHHEKGDDFTINYGNYGDPHSFIPYQLILLLIDFVFNWTMDLVHESPLAVLVIFVFQSLAIIINIILYIMASASQAMQVGIQKRVNIHHWLNLCVCLAYITVTGWWFIWALRKSWPSVSDQFSFTWRSYEIRFPNGTTVNTSTIAPPLSRNATGQSTASLQIKEHYTLWSPGFNAVYVIHRSLAMIYYFIYLRATFLVLNSQKIDAFLEMKRELVRRLREEKTDNASGRASTGTKRKSANGAFSSVPISSKMELGVGEYLNGNGFSLEDNTNLGERGGGGRKRNKKQMSVSWTDENKVGKVGSTSHNTDGGNIDIEEDTELPSKEIKKVKERSSKKKRQDGRDLVNYKSHGWDQRGNGQSDNEISGNDRKSEDEEASSPLPPRPKPRPSSSRHERRRKGGRDTVEEWDGNED